MSRRLVIGILVLLIVGVVGGTVALVVSRLRSRSQDTPVADVGSGSLQESSTGEQQVVDPTGDEDFDGLENADEALWGTDPNNADTDGDGFLDGEEVAAEHNPTIAGPNDLLPPGFVPGKELTPLEIASSGPIAVDQYFALDLDLNLAPNGRNLTEEYVGSVPENERNADSLKSYVLGQRIITQLPTPSEQAVNIGPNDSATAINEYLNTAASLKPFGDAYALAYAMSDLKDYDDPSGIRGLAYTLDVHQNTLIRLQVPPSAVNYHRLLLGYSELLKSTFGHLADWETDRVKATLAARQLDAINDTYYPLLKQELLRLQLLAIR